MLRTLLTVNFKRLLHTFFTVNSSKPRPKSKAKKAFTGILIAVMAIYIVAVLLAATGVFFASFAAAFGGGDLSWFYFALVCLAVFLFTFAGSVFTTHNILFDSNDNELLLSMPVPVHSVIASRMILLVMFDLVYAVMVSLPAAAIYFILFGFSFKVLLILLAVTLNTVILSAGITVFCGWVIALIGSKTRKNNLFRTAASLALFCAYFLFMSNIQSNINRLITNGEIIADAVRKYLPLFYYTGKACTEGNAAYLLISAVASIVPFVIACILVSKSFIGITSAQKSAKTKKYVAKDMKAGSAKSALLKKELSRFFTLPIYVLNCATGGIMALMLSVFILFKGSEVSSAIGAAGIGASENSLPVIIAMMLALCSGMSNSACASISLEGSRIDILRSMPVKPNDFYFAKYVSNLIIGSPPIAISVIAVSIGLNFGFAEFISLAVSVLAFLALTGFINMFCNALLPKFSWNSEATVIKQSASVVASMLSVMAVCATLYAPYLPLAEIITPHLYLCITAAVSVAGCFAFAGYFRTKGKTRFENMHS